MQPPKRRPKTSPLRQKRPQKQSEQDQNKDSSIRDASRPNSGGGKKRGAGRPRRAWLPRRASPCLDPPRCRFPDRAKLHASGLEWSESKPVCCVFLFFFGLVVGRKRGTNLAGVSCRAERDPWRRRPSLAFSFVYGTGLESCNQGRRRGLGWGGERARRIASGMAVPLT